MDTNKFTANYTSEFEKWLSKIRNPLAKIKITERIRRIEIDGHFGDFKSVGDEIFELRIHIHGGYRVYYFHDGEQIILLLCGGDKDSQERDLKTAKDILKKIKEQK